MRLRSCFSSGRRGTYRVTKLDPLVRLGVDELAVDKQLCAGDGGLSSIECRSGGREGTLEGGGGRNTAHSSVGQHGDRMMREDQGEMRNEWGRKKRKERVKSGGSQTNKDAAWEIWGPQGVCAISPLLPRNQAARSLSSPIAPLEILHIEPQQHEYMLASSRSGTNRRLPSTCSPHTLVCLTGPWHLWHL